MQTFEGHFFGGPFHGKKFAVGDQDEIYIADIGEGEKTRYRRHLVTLPKGPEPTIAVYVPESLSREEANKLLRGNDRRR